MPDQQNTPPVILGHTYGGNGGSPFDDRPQAASGPIAQITLHAGAFVDALSLTYGNLITWHGGPGGHPQNLTLAPGEYITQVEGRAGLWLDSLKLTTNLNQTIQGGGHGGQPFVVPNPDGLALHAIVGRDGDFIDQIQFVFGPPPPAAKAKAKKSAASPATKVPAAKTAAKKAPAAKKSAVPAAAKKTAARAAKPKAK